MKRTYKNILKSFALLFGVFIILAVLFLVKYSNLIKGMTPAETGAINDTVFCLKDNYVNVFLFKGNNGYLMIDAGICKENIVSEMAALEIKPEEVTDIILTHSDNDHTGALDAFENATIYMHIDEEQLINGQTARFMFKQKWKYSSSYSLFTDDESINLNGLSVKIIHTPGHTPGSCCFILNNDYLLTGDNLQFKDGEYRQFFELPNMDTKTQLESLRLLPEPSVFKYILTSHTGIILIN